MPHSRLSPRLCITNQLKVYCTLTIVFLVEQVGEFGFDVLVIVIPWARPTRALPTLPFDGIADISAILPRAEAGTQRRQSPLPVDVLRIIRNQHIDRIAYHSRARPAILGSDPI
jgi:hypothetical protein